MRVLDESFHPRWREIGVKRCRGQGTVLYRVNPAGVSLKALDIGDISKMRLQRVGVIALLRSDS